MLGSMVRRGAKRLLSAILPNELAEADHVGREDRGEFSGFAHRGAANFKQDGMNEGQGNRRPRSDEGLAGRRPPATWPWSLRGFRDFVPERSE
jgi:hypothetical protein